MVFRYFGIEVLEVDFKASEKKTFDLSFVAKACLAPDTPNGASSKVLVEQGGGEPLWMEGG